MDLEKVKPSWTRIWEFFGVPGFPQEITETRKGRRMSNSSMRLLRWVTIKTDGFMYLFLEKCISLEYRSWQHRIVTAMKLSQYFWNDQRNNNYRYVLMDLLTAQKSTGVCHASHTDFFSLQLALGSHELCPPVTTRCGLVLEVTANWEQVGNLGYWA